VYALGIVLAIVMGRFFRATLLRGQVAPFVMELPPYRAPMMKGLLIHMWDRSKIFLKKMGGIILIGSVVIWFLSAFPRDVSYSRDYQKDKASVDARYAIILEKTQDADDRAVLMTERQDILGAMEMAMAKERVEKSYLGQIGKFLEPVFSPLGIDWRGSVAVLSGFVAKEIVVSTLGVLYAAGEEADEESEALQSALKRSGMTALSAYALMVFVLIYVPCLATVSTIRRETNSWKWALFSIGYSCCLAWVVAFVIYQGGRLIGLE
jgi:ferrous iron transport protein B